MEVNRRHMVRVCTGWSCRSTGAADHLRALERRLAIACGQTADGRVSLEEAPCLSVCSLAPVVEVDGVCHGRVTSAAIDRLPMWFRTRPPSPVDVDASSFPPVHTVGETARERLDSLRARAEARARTRPDLRFLVQGGSCGEALGAGETIKALRLLAAMRGLDAEVLDGGCHGMCWAGIVVEVQRAGWPRLTFTHLAPDDVPDLLSAVTSNGSPFARFEGVAWNREGWRGVPPASRHPFFARQRRLIMERCGHLHPVSLDDAVLSDGFSALAHVLDRRVPEEVIEELKKTALGNAPKCFVVNGQEGIPGLFADRHLMEGDPYRVLEGLTIAGYVAGTTQSIVHINGAAHRAVQRMTRALAKAQAAGLVGDHVLGSTFSFHVEIQHGARGDSAATCDVATLAALPPMIAACEGADHDQHASATKLCGVSGPLNRPGLVEVDAEITLRELLSDIAGGLRDRRHGKRVLAVGPSGVLLSPESLDAPVTSLAGGRTGGIIAIPDDDPVGVEGDVPRVGTRDL